MKNFRLRGKLNTRISSRVWVSIVLLTGIIAGFEILMYHQWVNKQFQALSGAENLFDIEAQSAITRGQKGFSTSALKNSKYYIQTYEQVVQLENGTYFKQFSSDSATGLAVEIKEDKITFGDLNKDGKDDAAVIIHSSGGGERNFC